MKTKQIEKLLSGLIENLCKTITDDTVKDIILNKSFITGGCIPSMILGEFVNDFDIYLFSKGDVTQVKSYYESKSLKGKTEKKVEKEFLPTLITENAINLTDKIQIIIKWYGNPEEVTKHFDWKHIKSYYTKEKGLVLSDDLYRLIVEKELIYTGSHYPLSSLLRLKKFMKKGWTVSTPTMVHIALDIVSAFSKNKNTTNNMPLAEVIIEEEFFNYEKNTSEIDIDTLIHQLNGVDPLTIQAELLKHTGMHMPVNDIIDLLEKQ